MNHEQVIDFLKEVEIFKTCERTCRTTSTNRAESDAEHSWHLAIFLMLIENDLENIDSTKLLKLALIHDLPEIYAGDTNPFRDKTENKEENEKIAAKKLFSNLPIEMSEDFSSLFNEYLEQQTIESQIVKSADKLMPLIQNLCTNEAHSSYRKKEVIYKEVKEYMDKYFQSNSLLNNFYLRLLSEANNKGVFYNQHEKA
jgi:5'-deoxynucleotidase YfbR-like HD superfamily hydrolase